MDEPILSRTFAVGGRNVACCFFLPRPDQGDFICEYTIAFPEADRASYAYGIDNVQALFLAMQKAHMDLLTSAEYQRQGLTFHGSRDLCLPLPSGVAVEDFSNSKETEHVR